MGVVIGIGITLPKRVRGPFVSTTPPDNPLDDITVFGQYDSLESAVLDGIPAGGYYTLTVDNIYAMPIGVLMRNPPYTAYPDVEAGQLAEGDNVVFELAQGNPQGWPEGISIITNPFAAYSNDTQAGFGGVAIGELYVINEVNLGKRIKQRLS